MPPSNPLQSFSRTASPLTSGMRILRTCQQTSCAFSTSSPLQTKTIKPSRLPDKVIPPYPYGERQVYKQSNRGLYGSARIQFGNNVSEKHKVKTQRFWRPNILVKSFFSPAIGANIKTRLTMRVLKTIKREGGLENYLLKSKPARIKELGPGGWNLRWLLMQTEAVQKRFNEERVVLGLEPKEIEDRSDLIQYALDYATPGHLNRRSRETLARLQEQEMEEFILGIEDLSAYEGVEELTEEAEEALLAEAESAEEEEVTTKA
ncbi:unnamed protein product [Clonostachys solani]|uniref:50S ribosomal protein L24 n=1 Tax=Clonostachys solani TaxID=160281 RepID=A0A9N9YWX6_9HYPO|nr:unnamed protein product [Clonostachys solani]